ncbi:MAG: chemotaxis protein CheX [Bdellovibrionaceae bacterium]|nr:chemotaxis protein CheX [Pseudobdellovibrionaceae bacterium]MBX3033862.1 chemotaxis protein CheX [Pseudobdellovibrionaceae bacterium]
MSEVDNRLRSFFDEPVGLAFIQAVRQTVEMYFGERPIMTRPVITKDLQVGYDVAGVINFTSLDVEGSMVIAFRREFILKIYAHMLGESATDITPEVEDCVGELTNTIYGLAKAPLVDQGYRFPMGLPQVLRQVNKEFEASKCLELPFRFDSDKELSLVLVVKKLVKQAQSA